MNILITGSGLIGANAARHAVDEGHKVALFDLSPNACLTIKAEKRRHPSEAS
jgi:nucleoside-diphosphate-sugar epimerase